MRSLGAYKNGNYIVVMFGDGTKIRMNEEDTFVPEFPESMDIKITNSCSGFLNEDGSSHFNCPYCHECSYPGGKHANLNHPLFDSLKNLEEIALGGGNVMEHPDLVPFLERMTAKGVICNLTVHWRHFVQYYDTLSQLQESGKVHGIGISVNEVIPDGVIDMIANTPNAVVHCIAGIVSMELLEKMVNRGIRLLFLGYKNYGRGADYLKVDPHIMDRIAALHEVLPSLMKQFKVVSFDNLALEQLRVKQLVSEEIWQRCYMGGDGRYTMYVDMVTETYSRSSTNERKPIFSNNIIDLFNEVRNN